MNAQVTVPMVGLLRGIVVGEDSRDIERLWDKMLRGSYKLQGRAAALATSGIEIALWDIPGKSVALPVYRLLGGSYRERIRMYATLNLRIIIFIPPQFLLICFFEYLIPMLGECFHFALLLIWLTRSWVAAPRQLQPSLLEVRLTSAHAVLAVNSS